MPPRAGMPMGLSVLIRAWLVSLIGIWRIAYDPGALARGAFCLVP